MNNLNRNTTADLQKEKRPASTGFSTIQKVGGKVYVVFFSKTRSK